MKSLISFAIFFLSIGMINGQTNLNSSNFKNPTIMNNQENTAIETLLKSYEKALNASNTESILKLYAEDGVFMPSEAPTSIGKTAVEAAYNFVFSQIKLSIEFSIDAIEIHGDVAFARTISRGTVDILAAEISAPEENRELFVFKKVNGNWKIYQYIFNKMAPPSN